MASSGGCLVSAWPLPGSRRCGLVRARLGRRPGRQWPAYDRGAVPSTAGSGRRRGVGPSPRSPAVAAEPGRDASWGSPATPLRTQPLGCAPSQPVAHRTPNRGCGGDPNGPFGGFGAHRTSGAGRGGRSPRGFGRFGAPSTRPPSSGPAGAQGCPRAGPSPTTSQGPALLRACGAGRVRPWAPSLPVRPGQRLGTLLGGGRAAACRRVECRLHPPPGRSPGRRWVCVRVANASTGRPRKDTRLDWGKGIDSAPARPVDWAPVSPDPPSGSNTTHQEVLGGRDRRQAPLDAGSDRRRRQDRAHLSPRPGD